MQAARRLTLCQWATLFILLLIWHLYLQGPSIAPGLLWVLLPPLLLAIPGLWRGKLYTYKWLTLLVPWYFTHGVVDLWQPAPLFWLALLEVLLSCGLFVTAILYLRAHRASEAKTESAA